MWDPRPLQAGQMVERTRHELIRVVYRPVPLHEPHFTHITLSSHACCVFGSENLILDLSSPMEAAMACTAGAAEREEASPACATPWRGRKP